MYAEKELKFLGSLKGENYVLPLDYELSKIANEVLAGKQRVKIQPVTKIALNDGNVKILARGYQVETNEHRNYYWDNMKNLLSSENAIENLSEEQRRAIILGKELGEVDPFIRYLLGDFLLTTHIVQMISKPRIVISGQFEPDEILMFSVDKWDTFDIEPLSQFALTRCITGKTEAVYDQTKLNKARLLAKMQENIMIGLICIEAEGEQAEFRVLGDDDGRIVLFNAILDTSKPGYDLNLAPGEHTLMDSDLMARVQYAPFFYVNRGARETYKEQVTARRKNKLGG